jgi:3-hydroxyisobutyrate dehydrogenase
MQIGYIGKTPASAVLAQRLLQGGHQVSVLADAEMRAVSKVGAQVANSMSELARRCDVIFLDAGTAVQVRELVLGVDGLSQGLRDGHIVVDQTVGDPKLTAELATDLQKLGVALVDAPVHCELLAELSEFGVVLCGGSEDAQRTVRPLLDLLCKKVVSFGSVGKGHTARLLLGALAASNRLITLEGAAMGMKNGLSVRDMATVLNRCSGASAATARVLPGLGAAATTSDQTLESVVEELRLTVKLAMRLGAPVLLPQLVHGLLCAEANAFGPQVGMDESSRMFERAVRSLQAGADETSLRPPVKQ